MAACPYLPEGEPPLPYPVDADLATWLEQHAGEAPRELPGVELLRSLEAIKADLRATEKDLGVRFLDLERGEQP